MHPKTRLCYNHRMQSQAYILIGKSGSGKGTQAEILIDKLKVSGRNVAHIEMGEALRDFFQRKNFTAERAATLNQSGGLQPDFLANYFLTEKLIKYADGECVFIFDGIPRTKRQARVLDGALRFYGIESPVVIDLVVTDGTVINRMRDRGRSDDQIDSIRTRLEWYRDDTLRALEFFKQRDQRYRIVELDGEQGVEEIGRELIQRLGL